MLFEPDPDLACEAGQNGHLAVWLPHDRRFRSRIKQELFIWLRQKWADLFQSVFEVTTLRSAEHLLRWRDGTESESTPRLRRDGQSDRLQLIDRVVVTPDGFPLAYEP
jgi:hypothetical protein